MYYRGAHAALLMYDITNASSFEDIRGWLEGKNLPQMSCLSVLTGTLSLRTEKQLLSGSNHLHCRLQGRFAPAETSHIRFGSTHTASLVSTAPTPNTAASTATIYFCLHTTPLHLLHQHAQRPYFIPCETADNTLGGN